MLRKNFRKFILYPSIVVFFILLVSIIASAVFLVNIHRCQSSIQSFLSSSTGYKINFSNIHGSFNLRWQPTIKVDNLSVTNPKTQKKFMLLNNLQLSISYRSFFKRQIVLSQLKLDGSVVKITYDKQQNIFINNEFITNLNSKNKISFDAENFFLQLHKFTISDLDLTIEDDFHQLYPIKLHQLNLQLDNYLYNRHKILLTTQYAKSKLNLNLKFQGEKLSYIRGWQSGELNITNRDADNHNINLIAKVKDGYLESLDTNFDSSGRQFLGLNNPVKGKSQLAGNIQVVKNSESTYYVKANDLVVNTVAGPILNHATLTGSYEINKSGKINLSGLDLAGISSFKFYRYSEQISLKGNLNNISLTWDGEPHKPRNVELRSSFKDVSVTSLESSIPSINNINGSMRLREDSGAVSLSLKNSSLSFPQQLKQPIQITELNNITTWKTESSESGDIMVFKWNNSNLATKDWNLFSSGQYKNGIVNADLKMNHLEISAIPPYLPKKLSTMSDFLKSEMPGGWLSDMHVTINGPVDKLPFEHGGGQLKLSEQFHDVVLKFSPNWGAITKINGTLTTFNQVLNTKIVSGKLNNFNISNSEYTVPDIFADNLQLSMHGFASGDTADFVDYIRTTPLKTNLEHAPQQFIGKSEVTVKLDLPVNNPEKMKITGYWDFLENKFDFGEKIPQIDNFNGKLNFNTVGILPSKFSAETLGSNLEFSILNQDIFQLYSPNLNYSALIKFFTHENSNVITGRAATTVLYDNKQSRVSINTDLQGVTVAAASPLSKKESEIKSFALNFNQDPSNSLININYADTLYGLINLNQNMQFKSAKFSVGTPDLNIDYNNNFPLTLNAKLKNLNILEWTNFLNHLKQSEKPASNSRVSNTSEFFPVQIQLKTDAVWLKNYNIDGGRVDMSIDKNKVVGHITMPDIYGQLIYQNNKVLINLDKLLISKENLTDMHTAVAAPSTMSSTNIPDINLQVDNFYFQGHYLGQLNTSILQRNNSIYVESAALSNSAGKTIFRVIDHDLGDKREYTELRARTYIKNYGATVSKLGISNDLRGGNGLFDIGLKWRGGFSDFQVEQTLGWATLSVKNGEFTHVNPGLFGSLLGVVSLNSFTNVSGGNLNTFFGKGFAYNSLDMKVDIIFNLLKIENLKLVSNAASISSFGTINLKNQTIDSYLTVEPRLGTAVATTAGIVTLNPIIGGIVYAGEALIGNPINKALGLSYHITGKVANPTLVKFNLSDQIQQNFISSTNILSHPASVFDVQVNQ